MVRFKNRYIVVEIVSGKDISQPLENNSKDLYDGIINIVQHMHGDVGSSSIRSGFEVKYYNQLTKAAIIRVRHGPHKLVTSAIPFIRELKNTPVALKTIYLGATILQCNKALLKHQDRQLVLIKKTKTNF